MTKMVVVYAGETPPGGWRASAFIAGPMPRDPNARSWRPELLGELQARWTAPGTLVVFVPEARDRHNPDPEYVSQLWEERWMAVVDVIVFWVPRNMTSMPGLNSNIEFGRHESGGRLVLGLPAEAVSVQYLRRAVAARGGTVATTLADTAQSALDYIGHGADRHGSERDVPLLIWQTQVFETWRSISKPKLQSARLLWAWSPAPQLKLVAWAMHVRTSRDGEQLDELLIAVPENPNLLSIRLPIHPDARGERMK